MNRRGERLMEELPAMARRHGESVQVFGVGPAFHLAFTDEADIHDYRSFIRTDGARRDRFNARLHSESVRITARGTWFLSAAHSDEDIEESLAAADRAFPALKEE